MKFYTKADKKTNKQKLEKIVSKDDYEVLLKKKKNINFKNFSKIQKVHPEYFFIKDFIEKEIKHKKIIAFHAVYDLSKIAYFLNKYPNKKFILTDVYVDHLYLAKKVWKNIEIKKINFFHKIENNAEISIINNAEYFMTNEELSKLIQILNNVIMISHHIFSPKKLFFVYKFLHLLRAKISNHLSLFFKINQYQFRGYWRTINDMKKISKLAKKKIRLFENKVIRTNNFFFKTRIIAFHFTDE